MKKKYLYLFESHRDMNDSPPSFTPNITVCNDLYIHYGRPAYTLKHHFCAADGLVSSQWRDRLNSSIYLSPRNSPIFTDDYVRIGQKDGRTTIDRTTDMLFYTNNSFLNLGYYWKISLEVKILSGYLGAAMHLLDLCSTCQSNKGVTLAYNPSTNVFSSNFKMFGNETMGTHPEYNLQNPDAYLLGIGIDKWYTINMICTKYDNNNSILYYAVEHNGMQKIIPRYKFPNVTLSGLSNTGQGVFGQYVIGSACVNNATYNTGNSSKDKSSMFLLKNIWIYEEKEA